jgi:hypothetical protein
MAKNYFVRIISLCIGMLLITAALQGQIYVNSAAISANNGTSWADAYTDLQTALAAAVSPVEIWVAAGIYYPDEGLGQTNDDRNSTLKLVNGVALYGGFAGTETMLSQRDWETNPTILSGDINQSGTLAGNSYTIVRGSNTNSTAVLDGFTITKGNSDGGVQSGGGMYNVFGSPKINNCNISGNTAIIGGGMYNSFYIQPNQDLPDREAIRLQNELGILARMG